MRLLFVPDSFKGSLSSTVMCQLLEEEAHRVFPQAECISIPMADGGEGTVEAMVSACGGEIGMLPVIGPDGRAVQAAYGVIADEDDDAAVVEMAQASGLPLMAKPDPMTATSFGTGMLLRHCLEAGYHRIYVGIGGSATNDVGMGMLTALGARFLDAQGRDLTGSGAELMQVHTVDLSELMPEAIHADIRVMADVNNPLLGENGATMVYGPQKGATPEQIFHLEAGMAHYADVLEQAIGRSIRNLPGAGAAGGMGAALCGVLHGSITPGMDVMLAVSHLRERLPGTSLVITGEGCLDKQSICYGKICGVIAGLCADAHVPVLAIVGGMGEGSEDFARLGLTSVMPITPGPMSLAEAITAAQALYADAAARAFRMLQMGTRL